MSPALRKVALLLAGSGFCALVYQTAWLRMLRLVFGASTASSAAVLAIFMAGLGFGGLWLGRRVDKLARPLAFYARLEGWIALSAALSPLLIWAVRAAYVALGGSSALGSFGGTLVRLLLSAVVLGIPTFLMGGTLPAAVRAVETADDRGRRSLGWLYAINTLGAVAGALLPTFFAFEALGIRKTLWIAALLNLLVALAARRLAESLPVSAGDEEAPAAASEAGRGDIDADPEGGAGTVASPRFVAVGAAGVGFVFLLMEIVWYRMLAPLLGGSSYTFGLILAVALAGIGLGGLLYGAGRRWRRPTLAAFAATCALEALCLAVPFAWGDGLAVLAALLRHMGAGGFATLTLSWTAVTALVVFPTAVVSGYQFPLLVALLGSGRRRLGREVGITYAANTVGAIAGSIAGGFGLIPLLGAPGVWRLSVGLLLALAALALGLEARTRRGFRALALPAAAALAAIALLCAPGPGPFWRHSPIGAGRVPASWNGPNDVEKDIRERDRQVVWEADGIESSVALHVDQEAAFLINGKSDGSALSDAPTQVMSGLVGAMLHPNPRRALVIGLGTGSTAGWLAQVPSIERVDVVELEPAVVEVARACAAVNHRVLDNPKVHVWLGDGRERLLTSRERYDIVFSEPSNPFRAGVASLFSEDFYRAVAERLAPGGLFLQWLQGYEVDPQVVRTAVATLGHAFPAVESWELQGSDLLLVASARPVAHDVDRVRRRALEEPFRSALWNVWGVEGAEGFYAGFIANPALSRAFVRQEDGRINTDDRPLLEYGFVRNLGRLGLFSIADLRRLAATRGEDRPAFVPSARPLDAAVVRELRGVRRVYWGRWSTESTLGTGGAALRDGARHAYDRGELGEACQMWGGQEQVPTSHLDLLLVAECRAAAGDPGAPHFARQLAVHQPIEAALAVARWQHARGQEGAAARLLADAFTAYRGDPWVFRPMAQRALGLATELARLDREHAGTLYGALAKPFAARALEQARLRERVDLVDLYDRTGHCAEALAPFEPHVPWEEKFLRYRAACYAATGRPQTELAVADLARFRGREPEALDVALPKPDGKAGW
jgi:spermidine synthase